MIFNEGRNSQRDSSKLNIKKQPTEYVYSVGCSLVEDYSPVTIVSYLTIRLNILEVLRSTVEIFEIPPFLAADLMLASWLKNKAPKKPVACAVPTLLPTELLVAVTGKVKAQLETITATTNAPAIVFNELYIVLVFKPYSYGFSESPRFLMWHLDSTN